jgi:hypothetical protein
MANSPNPDRDVSYMREKWGTNRLITDYGSENIVTPTKNNKNDPPEDRLSKFCGGANGFDDYAEWLT